MGIVAVDVKIGISAHQVKELRNRGAHARHGVDAVTEVPNGRGEAVPFEDAFKLGHVVVVTSYRLVSLADLGCQADAVVDTAIKHHQVGKVGTDKHRNRCKMTRCDA